MIITRYSLIKGDVTRKENVTPKGIPASIKLKNIGIDEQEQNGVIEPNNDANILANTPLLLIHYFTLCCEI